MNFKKVKKLLLKQGFEETKIDELLKELEAEADDDETQEVKENVEVETPSEVVDEKVDETTTIDEPVKEVEVETATQQESEPKEEEVEKVAQKVVDETLDEKLPHDEKVEEKEMQLRDEHLKSLDEQIKSLVERQDVFLARITELEKQLNSIAVVDSLKDVGETNTATLTKPNTNDVLSEVLRKLNTRR